MYQTTYGPPKRNIHRNFVASIFIYYKLLYFADLSNIRVVLK